MSKTNQLPPDIERIREMTAREFFIFDKVARGILVSGRDWAECEDKPPYFFEADALLSKLTELGVVVLVEKVSDILDAYKVINLDGTPKEG